MPSASAIIQFLISQVLSGVSNTICYISDVLVLTKTHDEHLNVIDKVFIAVPGTGVKINTVKN